MGTCLTRPGYRELHHWTGSLDIQREHLTTPSLTALPHLGRRRLSGLLSFCTARSSTTAHSTTSCRYTDTHRTGQSDYHVRGSHFYLVFHTPPVGCPTRRHGIRAASPRALSPHDARADRPPPAAASPLH